MKRSIGVTAVLLSAGVLLAYMVFVFRGEDQTRQPSQPRTVEIPESEPQETISQAHLAETPEPQAAEPVAPAPGPAATASTAAEPEPAMEPLQVVQAVRATVGGAQTHVPLAAHSPTSLRLVRETVAFPDRTLQTK